MQTVQRFDKISGWCGRNKNKRNKALNILNNIESSLFEGESFYHYKDVTEETEYEKSIAERAKVKRQRLDEVTKREKKT